MRYVVHTRQTIRAITPAEPHILVSISDCEPNRPKLPINAACLGVLKMTFHDVVKGRHYGPEIVAFDAKMADTLLDFWIGYRSIADTCYVHCDGGQCRSPGVAAALERLETGQDAYWFERKRPNILVYRTILDRGYARQLNAA